MRARWYVNACSSFVWNTSSLESRTSTTVLERCVFFFHIHTYEYATLMIVGWLLCWQSYATTMCVSESDTLPSKEPADKIAAAELMVKWRHSCGIRSRSWRIWKWVGIWSNAGWECMTIKSRIIQTSRCICCEAFEPGRWVIIVPLHWHNGFICSEHANNITLVLEKKKMTDNVTAEQTPNTQCFAHAKPSDYLFSFIK